MTLYEILGVDQTVTPDVLKTTWRKLAREHHPDLNAGDDARFKELAAAYEVLSDPVQRAAYDAEISYAACVLCGAAAWKDLYVCRSCASQVLNETAEKVERMNAARQRSAAPRQHRQAPRAKTEAERLEEEWAWTNDPLRYAERMGRDPRFYDQLNRPGTDDYLQAILVEDAIRGAEEEADRIAMRMRMRGGVVEVQVGEHTVRADRQTVQTAKKAHRNLTSAWRIASAIGRWLSST